MLRRCNVGYLALYLLFQKVPEQNCANRTVKNMRANTYRFIPRTCKMIKLVMILTNVLPDVLLPTCTTT